MIFESISISNFRNFEKSEISLSNKNVFFGMNDIGKTNFLFALRFLLDKDIRKDNLQASDFYKKRTNKPIEITLSINISDDKDIDNQKLRAKLKGSILSTHNSVYVKLIAKYDEKEMVAIPLLYWGGDLQKMYEIKQRGYMYEIDYILDVFYIDSYVDLSKLFKKSIPKLIKNNKDEDKDIINQIDELVTILNDQISSLSGIQKFESDILPEYQKYRNEDLSISVKSEIAIKGLFSNIMPYIKRKDDEILYPTTGEGRKKLLVYSIFDLISKESHEKKIPIFLIEEPENHLHKSLQIAISDIIFNNDNYNYVFLTTHSPYILYEMNNVNLVRIFNENKIDSKSDVYKVPEQYIKLKKTLNKNLSEAIFSEKVLLVEGPSEALLFDTVLSSVDKHYTSKGIYVLPVNGIGFGTYFRILDNLKINNMIKTDNDLKFDKKSGKFNLLGISRINSYIKEEDRISIESVEDNSIDTKKKIFDKHKEKIVFIAEKYNIYLSKVDLENDLDECIHDEMVKHLKTDNPVEYLVKAKQNNMVELIEKLSNDDCLKIYNHERFSFLKVLL